MTAIEVADLKNDTFYWGRASANDRPHNRDTPDEALLIKLTDQPHWLVLYPEALNVGWRLTTDERLLPMHPMLLPYRDSHRGWWAKDVEVLRVYDDCCEQPVEELVLAEPDLAELKAQVAAFQDELAGLREVKNRAYEDRDRAWIELDRFKELVSEVGLKYATAHDMCGVYDDIMDELGLPRRESEHSVTVRCHFTTTVTVMARSEEEAVDVANENLETTSYWRPPSMFASYDMDSPWDLEFDTDV
jgi:hypothetical protein